MLLWFFSGLVMVYSGSTAVTQQERLVHAKPISLHDASALLSVGEVWRLSEQQRSSAKFTSAMQSHDHDKQKASSIKLSQLKPKVIEARLTVINNSPVWQIEDDAGRHYALSALNGDIQNISTDSALQISKTWIAKEATPQVIKVVDKDLGTRMMMFDSYRPFIKVAIGDSAGTELDISSKTGEVVVVTTQLQRILAYSGEWLHYFRFLDSLGFSDYRKPILTWTSFTACFAVLVGLIVGWLRWRPGWFGTRIYNNGQVQPYRESWSKWHFWLGLTGGIITLTWILSGFLVNNPWEIFTKAKFSQQQLLQFQGGPLSSELLATLPEAILPKDMQTVELLMRTIGGQSFVRAYAAIGKSLAIGRHKQEEKEKSLLEAAQRLLPKAKIKDYVLITDYDDFYYPNHRKSLTERPLPVLRVNFNDSADHRVYIDPTEGRVLLKIDHSRRAYRWLFFALHNWDLGVLYSRPLWDVWMVIWSLIGLILSMTSLYIGWRRMKVSIKNCLARSGYQNKIKRLTNC
ncbi:MAG: hypothetical protein HOO90_06325 [Methylotenera sp.]|nr:hypothetical protein [Methylotenera sp.]